jgi:hypothetical protein
MPALVTTGPAPNLLIVGNSIYWGITRNNYSTGAPTFPSVYVGTPLINPVWTELGNLDPSATAAQAPAASPSLFYGAGSIYEIFIRPNPNAFNTQIQAIITANLFSTSQSVTFSDTLTGGPEVIEDNPLLVFGPSAVYVASGSSPHEGGSVPTTFFVGPPLVVLGSIRITLRGVKLRQICSLDEPGQVVPQISSVPRAL